MRAHFLLLTFLAVVVAVAAASARASSVPPIVQPTDYCKLATAHHTLWYLSDQGLASADDDFVDWENTPCGRFVVDIVVPGSPAGDAFFVGGGYEWATPGYGQSPYHFQYVTADQCNSYHGDLRVYAKGAFETQYKLIGGGTTHGEPSGWGWIVRCFIVNDSGYLDVPKPLYPGLLGATRYRIAIATWFGAYPGPTSAWAADIEWDH